MADPFGPTKACTVLRRTERSTSSTALRPPKYFERWLISRMAESVSRRTQVVSADSGERSYHANFEGLCAVCQTGEHDREVGQNEPVANFPFQHV